MEGRLVGSVSRLRRRAGAAARRHASRISTSPSSARRRGSARIATPCGRGSPRSPASASTASPSKRRPASSSASSAAAKASRRSRPQPYACRGVAMTDAESETRATRVLDACRAPRSAYRDRRILHRRARRRGADRNRRAPRTLSIAASSPIRTRPKRRCSAFRPRFSTRHGAVSRADRRGDGHRRADASQADIAVAITGIAGPGGGSKEKPVGLVHFAACASRQGALPAPGKAVRRYRTQRGAARSVAEALAMLEDPWWPGQSRHRARGVA